MKLTNQQRAEIIAKCVRQQFEKQWAAYDTAREKLADAVYAAEYGEHEATARQLPQGWIDYHNKITIRRAGFAHAAHTGKDRANDTLVMSERRPFPRSTPYSIPVDAHHPCAAQADKVVALFEKLHAERTALESDLTGILASCTTLDKLRAAWPQGAKFFPKEAPKQTALVPVALVENVNKKMGLK